MSRRVSARKSTTQWSSATESRPGRSSSICCSLGTCGRPSRSRRRALEARPELRKARLEARQAEYDRRLKKAEWIPDLSLTVNYVRLFNEQVLPTSIASAGVLFSWDVYDWGRKQRELAGKTKT